MVEFEGIISRTQTQVIRFHSVLGIIDQILVMFYANANGKGFSLHLNLAFMHHLISVSGRMADPCKDKGTSYCLRAVYFNAPKLTIFYHKVRYLSTKADFSAPIYNLLTHGLNHAAQDIRTYMRLMFVKDFFWCAMLHKIRRDFVEPRVSHSGGQLTIRKGTSSTFPKLYVRFSLKRTCLPKTFHI